MFALFVFSVEFGRTWLADLSALFSHLPLIGWNILYVGENNNLNCNVGPERKIFHKLGLFNNSVILYVICCVVKYSKAIKNRENSLDFVLQVLSCFSDVIYSTVNIQKVIYICNRSTFLLIL